MILVNTFIFKLNLYWFQSSVIFKHSPSHLYFMTFFPEHRTASASVIRSKTKNGKIRCKFSVTVFKFWLFPTVVCLSVAPQDPCLSLPCLNQGTCAINGDGFYCTCPLQFEGTFCEIEKGEIYVYVHCK